MAEHKSCEAIVVSCMDFRFQKYIYEWVQQHSLEGNHDRVAWAGGVLDLDSIIEQIDLSVKLHSIRKVVLMNHENCGGYGEDGTYERHKRDLLDAASKIKSLYSQVEVEAYYLRLDGTFEDVST